MIEEHITIVQRPIGATQTGSGAVQNNHHYYGIPVPQVQFVPGDSTFLGVSNERRRAGTVAAEHARWLTARFVAPPGYAEAQELLENNSFLAVVAASGSGRHTAALMLLHAFRRPGSRLVEVFPEGEEQEEQPLDPRLIEKGDRVLLDLRAAQATSMASALAALPSFRAAAEERDARLVVVMPQATRDSVPTVAQPVVQLGRANEHQVLQRHLRANDIRPPLADVTRHLPEKDLAERSMGGLAQLAGLIGSARDRQPSSRFADWCTKGLLASTPWQSDVFDKIVSHEAGGERALLFVAAMLNGASGDTVFAATRILLQVVKQPTDDLPPLEHADLGQQLKNVSAEIDPGGRVRFKELAFDAAVRFHFWTHRPDLRESFRFWVERTVREAEPGPEERQDLISRFAEQCIRTGRFEDLARLAKTWTRENEKPALMADAANALARGVQSEAAGGWFLHRIYRWSCHRALSERFRTVLVRICAEVILPSHPPQALVRLHHLARGEYAAGTTTAQDALLEAVLTDEWRWQWMLTRLSQSLEEKPRQEDAALFLHLTAPDRLLKEGSRLGHGLRTQLITGWRAAHSELPRSEWAGPQRSWLSTCVGTENGDRLLDVLVTAADGKASRLAAVYDTAKAWAYAAPEQHGQRLEVVNRLREMIDIAQEMAGTAG